MERAHVGEKVGLSCMHERLTGEHAPTFTEIHSSNVNAFRHIELQPSSVGSLLLFALASVFLLPWPYGVIEVIKRRSKIIAIGTY